MRGGVLRRTVACLFLCAALAGSVCLASCRSVMQDHTIRQGVKVSYVADSSLLLCRYLLPDDFLDFLLEKEKEKKENREDNTEPGVWVDEYDNDRWDYEYHGFGNTRIEADTALFCFRFENEEDYREAKRYYLDHMTLAEETYSDYASFCFYRIVGFFEKYEEPTPDMDPREVALHRFPYAFTMAAFSDEERAIVAFGHVRWPLVVDTDDWAVFLFGHFPFFDWDEAKMVE
ncbi:MAG: hypothetical protein J6125_00245 [Clostridia bacterium]|nr:hypothetical protein [Clostridia bacterium]